MPELTKTHIIALIGFLLILVSIPISTYLVRESQIFRSRASESSTPSTATVSGTVTKPRPVPSTSPLTDLQKLIEGSDETTPTPEAVNLSFGPTLNFKVTFEGRPAGKQADKVFVGISGGNTKTSPQYIITFSIDIPDSGEFKGLSLAGLDPGSIYTAYIKGTAQIDASATFAMSPTETNLNNNEPLYLISGDLNEDNVINSSDYTITRLLYGKTSSSAGWNDRADLNKDGLINNYDLAYIIKNTGKIGASGTWISTPAAATPSTTLITKPNVGGPPTNSSYWLYIP